MDNSEEYAEVKIEIDSFCFVYETKMIYLCFVYKTISSMDKELIKQIIGENQEFVEKVSFMERPFTFEDAGNYVFLGIRRQGSLI